MPIDRIKRAKKVTIGTKQVTKAVEKGAAKVVFVAKDAENRVVLPLLKLCQDKKVEVVEVDNMLELGRACGIQVGSASAAIIEE